MSDSQEPIRERTSARLGFVAPPGMSVGKTNAKMIGRYEVIRTLGKGAMGVVYKARDPRLDRTVAVKTIVAPRNGKKLHAAYLERFEREAKAAAKMQHPSIVTIFDSDVENGAPYMVLEYLPGETLADRLDRVRLPLGKAVQIALDLAGALGYAHRQRIVHRDVKPANVIAADENRWKLTDFGIVRLPDSDLTQAGIFMGTPGYAPPEAIRLGHYTPQADVFAWGAVFYEMLSGRIPYEGPDTRTTNSYVIKATAPSPRKYDASIPEPLAEIAMTALSPSAKDRYKDGAEAEKALKEAWSRCLRANMIPPACLLDEELAHEQVRGEMHKGTITSEAAAAAAAMNQSGAGQPAAPTPGMAPYGAEYSSDRAPIAPAVLPSLGGQGGAQGGAPASSTTGPMLVIESSAGHQVPDDAPTQVISRDSSGPFPGMPGGAGPAVLTGSAKHGGEATTPGPGYMSGSARGKVDPRSAQSLGGADTVLAPPLKKADASKPPPAPKPIAAESSAYSRGAQPGGNPMAYPAMQADKARATVDASGAPLAQRQLQPHEHTEPVGRMNANPLGGALTGQPLWVWLVAGTLGVLILVLLFLMLST